MAVEEGRAEWSKVVVAPITSRLCNAPKAFKAVGVLHNLALSGSTEAQRVLVVWALSTRQLPLPGKTFLAAGRESSPRRSALFDRE